MSNNDVVESTTTSTSIESTNTTSSSSDNNSAASSVVSSSEVSSVTTTSSTEDKDTAASGSSPSSTVSTDTTSTAPAAAKTTTAAPSIFNPNDIVLGPGSNFFAAFGLGAAGGGTKGPVGGPTTKKETQNSETEEISLRPGGSGGYRKQGSGYNENASSDNKHNKKQYNNKDNRNNQNNNKETKEKDAQDGKQKKRFVYTAGYLRKFQSKGGAAPEDMSWYLQEVKPAVDQSQLSSPNQQFSHGQQFSPQSHQASPHSGPANQQRKQHNQKKYPQDSRQPNYHNPQQQPQQQPLEDPNLPHRKSANPWLPKYQAMFGTSDPNTQYRQKVTTYVVGLLNKLTLENFDSLSTDIVKQLKEARGSDLKEEIISQVFEKAVTEPNFSNMYASLCLKIDSEMKQWKITVPPNTDKEETFKTVLLSLCQKQFERSIDRTEQANTQKEPEERPPGVDDDWEELKLAKIKKRNLGNVRFVGELFKKKLLRVNIIHDCIQMILKKPLPTESDIEILCGLLNTVGKSIDVPKAETYIQIYFKKINKLSQTVSYPSRIRFMLMDTIDLRANKWVPRKEQNAPQKIADIHAKAHEEDQMNAAMGHAFATMQHQLTQQSSAGNVNKPAAPTTPKKQDAKKKEKKEVEDTTELEGTIDTLIEEFLSSRDTEEAASCLKELKSRSAPQLFVLRATNFYAERRPQECTQIFSLLEYLVNKNVLSSGDLTKGFSQIFQIMEDLALDAPNAPERVGELIGKCAKLKWLPPFSNKEFDRITVAKYKQRVQASYNTNYGDSNGHK